MPVGQTEVAGIEGAVWRAQRLAEFVTVGRRLTVGMRTGHCRLAGELARRLGLREDVRPALLQMFERWDGHGDPGLASGEAISAHSAEGDHVFHAKLIAHSTRSRSPIPAGSRSQFRKETDQASEQSDAGTSMLPRVPDYRLILVRFRS